VSIFSFVKNKVSILDVVLDYSSLKQAGNYWKGMCPFHNETDASFTVSPDRQIFYCFGCNEGGDVVTFISKVENLSMIEAAQHLIEKYNIKLDKTLEKELSKSFGDSKNKNQFFHTCESFANWISESIFEKSISKDYLGSRGISKDSCKKFRIGYLPGGTRSLNKLVKDMADKNILLDDLVDAGIVIKGQNSIYSPFEDRIIFPITDSLGRCCGFGGRVFKTKDTRAKYYNSRDSEFFSKGKLFFGFDLAKSIMQKLEKAFLVEGYTDCVLMSQYGYENTVATLGTACTIDHLRMISRHVKTLYVLYDGDEAGQKAVLRLAELCWGINLELKIIRLPDKDDPASFLVKNKSMDNLIQGASDVFSFFVDSTGGKFWNKSFSERMDLCSKLIQVIAKVDDGFKKEILLQKSSSAMQVPVEVLKNKMEKVLHEVIKSEGLVGKNKDKNESLKVSKFDSVPSIERKIFSLVANSLGSEYSLHVDSDLLPYFSDPIRGLLHKIDDYINNSEGEDGTFDCFLENLDEDSERNWIVKNSLEFDADNSRDLFEKLLFSFRVKNWKRIVNKMKRAIFEAERRNNKNELERLLISFSKLKEDMKQRGLV